MKYRAGSCIKAWLLSSALVLASAPGAMAQFGGNMPPPAVGVVQVKAQSVPVVSELPGRIVATRVAEVRARVSGVLLERLFEQGAVVKAGDVLYRIDPRLFKAQVARADAALLRAKATQANAKLQLERQRVLLEKKVASQAAYDLAVAESAAADADVAAAKAALDEARINLGFTEVRAPISGVIGGALITEGALVTAEGESSLALIQQIDPVYADFTQSAEQYLGLKRAVAEGRLGGAGGEAPVSLAFSDGLVYGSTGTLLFASADVDPTTGQVTQRAEFKNPQRDLLPGMYVRVRVAQAVRAAAITIPQRAVFWTAGGQPQVYVIGEDGTAQIREVTLGIAGGDGWFVESGLEDGMTVIVDGVQKVQPGGKVVPEAWTPPHTASAAASGAE